MILFTCEDDETAWLEVVCSVLSNAGMAHTQMGDVAPAAVHSADRIVREMQKRRADAIPPDENGDPDGMGH